jgi:ABC-type phosphate transport system permease subunit
MNPLLFFFICYMAIASLLIGLMSLMFLKRILRFSRNNFVGGIVTAIFWLPILIYSLIVENKK